MSPAQVFISVQDMVAFRNAEKPTLMENKKKTKTRRENPLPFIFLSLHSFSISFNPNYIFRASHLQPPSSLRCQTHITRITQRHSGLRAHPPKRSESPQLYHLPLLISPFQQQKSKKKRKKQRRVIFFSHSLKRNTRLLASSSPHGHYTDKPTRTTQPTHFRPIMFNLEEAFKHTKKRVEKIKIERKPHHNLNPYPYSEQASLYPNTTHLRLLRAENTTNRLFCQASSATLHEQTSSGRTPSSQAQPFTGRIKLHPSLAKSHHATHAGFFNLSRQAPILLPPKLHLTEVLLPETPPTLPRIAHLHPRSYTLCPCPKIWTIWE